MMARDHIWSREMGCWGLERRPQQHIGFLMPLLGRGLRRAQRSALLPLSPRVRPRAAHAYSGRSCCSTGPGSRSPSFSSRVGQQPFVSSCQTYSFGRSVSRTGRHSSDATGAASRKRRYCYRRSSCPCRCSSYFCFESLRSGGGFPYLLNHCSRRSSSLQVR